MARVLISWRDFLAKPALGRRHATDDGLSESEEGAKLLAVTTTAAATTGKEAASITTWSSVDSEAEIMVGTRKVVARLTVSRDNLVLILLSSVPTAATPAVLSTRSI